MPHYFKWILLLFSLPLHAQTNAFFWVYDLCSYQSYFDSTVTNAASVIGASELLLWDEYRIHNCPAVFKPSDIAELDMQALVREYTDKMNRLSALQLPDNTVWESFRLQKMQEIEQVYHISKITYTAFLTENMAALGAWSQSDSCMHYYARALLSGGDSLIAAWEHITALQAAANAFPEYIWAEYYQQCNTPDKWLYGKIQLLTFGWWNCAVGHVAYFDHHKAFQEFQKLFVSTVIIDCEEP